MYRSNAWFIEYGCDCDVYGACARSPERVLSAVYEQAGEYADFADAMLDSSTLLRGTRREWNASPRVISRSTSEWLLQWGTLGGD